MPEFRNIHVFDLMKYRLPWAGKVSILHRVSGLLMFVLIPFVLYLLIKASLLKLALRLSKQFWQIQSSS